MLGREGHISKHISLCIVHEGSELRPSDAKLVGDMPPCLNGSVMVGLEEGLADRGCHHGVLPLRHIGERITHGMNPASLPRRAEHTGDGGLQSS